MEAVLEKGVLIVEDLLSELFGAKIAAVLVDAILLQWYLTVSILIVFIMSMLETELTGSLFGLAQLAFAVLAINNGILFQRFLLSCWRL